jgi:hypothetical protein
MDAFYMHKVGPRISDIILFHRHWICFDLKYSIYTFGYSFLRWTEAKVENKEIERLQAAAGGRLEGELLSESPPAASSPSPTHL